MERAGVWEGDLKEGGGRKSSVDQAKDIKHIDVA